MWGETLNPNLHSREPPTASLQAPHFLKSHICLLWNQKWELLISRPSAILQPAFFFPECSVMFTQTGIDENFWGGTSIQKATEIHFFHSWGTKAAWLDLLILILGALVYLSNHKYSDSYSYQNWRLDCNANGSLKYCWNCCLGNSALDLVLHHYSCWTKLLWKLSSQEASGCAIDCDPWDRRSWDLFIFFLVICSSSSQ